MKWPRGRYNGKRIVGFEFHVYLDVTMWYWRPRFAGYVGGVHWLCFRTFTTASYE